MSNFQQITKLLTYEKTQINVFWVRSALPYEKGVHKVQISFTKFSVYTTFAT